MKQKTSAEPEIPDEVQRRGATALTHIAEESGAEAKEGLTEVGQSGVKYIDGGPTPAHVAKAAQMRQAKARKARQRAEQNAPAEPIRGMTAAQVEEVRGRSYEKAPRMDPTLGDKTQAFVNWLFKNHPQDAYIRYYARDVWPTE